MAGRALLRDQEGHQTGQESRSSAAEHGPSVDAMDINIHTTFLPTTARTPPIAFYIDKLGFELRNDVGYNGMHWLTVGPARTAGVNLVLFPPGADPGVTEDERRTITEMMAKGTYASIMLTPPTWTAPSSSSRPVTSTSSRSPSSRTGACATPPYATPAATWSGSRRCADMKTMTCTQLGGPCDLGLRGETADDVIKLRTGTSGRRSRAGDPVHGPARDDMKGRWKHPIKGMGWYKDTKKAFAALPED